MNQWNELASLKYRILMEKVSIKIVLQAVVLTLVLTGCANRGGSNAGRQVSSPERTIDLALEEMGNCLKSTPKGNKAQCANQLYSRINSGISDSDPDKAPGLTMVTKIYTLLSKFDRGEITSPQDMQNGMRQIVNETAMDAQRARYYSAAQGEMESRRQRQLFQDAQRLLAPVQSPVQTCTPAFGAPPGTLVCR